MNISANFSLDDTNTSAEAAVSQNSDPRPDQDVLLNVALALAVAIIMVGVGCVVDIDEVKQELRRPVGVGIGLLCQFLLLPLISFAMAHVLQFRKWDALGMLVVSTCPGGTLSNVLAYFMDGNVPLSVTMTSVSTAMSIGMMPLNLWVYSRSWTNEKTRIPYLNIVVTLVGVVLPVVIGMLILKKAPRVAKWLVRIGSVIGLLVMVFSTVKGALQYPALLQSVGWKTWFCAITHPMYVFGLSYLLTLMCRRSHPVCRTIALETSCQNVVIALSLSFLSFPMSSAVRVIRFPLLYGISSLGMALCFVILVKLRNFCRDRAPESSEDKTATEEFLGRSETKHLSLSHQRN